MMAVTLHQSRVIGHSPPLFSNLIRRISRTDPNQTEMQTPAPSEEGDDHAVIATDPTGRFERFKKCLGMGAYKRVYLAFDQEEGVEVAWNELRIDHLQAQDIEKVLSEVQILKSLRHDSIINLYHCWTAREESGRDQVYFITELMTSGTLKAYIRKTKGILKPKVIKNWSRQILKGLEYLHSRQPPIIHRDLKCENIFINGNNGQAKIGDLGLATVKQRDFVSSVLGTPEFMAPELYDEKYDEKVDVYAFGMCVLEMVTKEYPYNECSNQAQIFRKVTSNIKPAVLDTVTDPQIKSFIELCIEFDPLRRPSASQLLDHPFITAPDPLAATAAQAASPSSANAELSPTEASIGNLMVISTAATATSTSTFTLAAPDDEQQQQQQHTQLQQITPISSSSTESSAIDAAAGVSTRISRADGILSVQALSIEYPLVMIKMICLTFDGSSGGDPSESAVIDKSTSSITSSNSILTGGSSSTASGRFAPRKQEVKFPYHLVDDTAGKVVDEMVREGVLPAKDRDSAVENIQELIDRIIAVFARRSSTISTNTDSVAEIATATATPSTLVADAETAIFSTATSSATGAEEVKATVNIEHQTDSSQRLPGRLLRARSLSVGTHQQSKRATRQHAVIPRFSPNVKRSRSFSSPASKRLFQTMMRHQSTAAGNNPATSLASPSPPALSNFPGFPETAETAARKTASTAGTYAATAADAQVLSTATSPSAPPQTLQQSLSSSGGGGGGMSYYQMALEEKTNEIIEGVYKSQFRRGVSAASSAGSERQSLSPAVSLPREIVDLPNIKTDLPPPPVSRPLSLSSEISEAPSERSVVNNGFFSTTTGSAINNVATSTTSTTMTAMTATIGSTTNSATPSFSATSVRSTPTSTITASGAGGLSAEAERQLQQLQRLALQGFEQQSAGAANSTAPTTNSNPRTSIIPSSSINSAPAPNNSNSNILSSANTAAAAAATVAVPTATTHHSISLPTSPIISPVVSQHVQSFSIENENNDFDLMGSADEFFDDPISSSRSRANSGAVGGSASNASATAIQQFQQKQQQQQHQLHSRSISLALGSSAQMHQQIFGGVSGGVSGGGSISNNSSSASDVDNQITSADD